uniref:putative RuBisCO transcriptional regulator n=1 Tax=Cutleria multifida TaxID=74475 RepID=UPI002E76A8A3|nr:putative RuBisCO transcriptional regulator [Cutleria multifida]WAM62607.1 putative RuBisCO transcriptional regulator [Cutleria multifida]
MKYFPFNIEHLKVLQIIKNETNLKKAAKKLYISQPALSLKIQNLESKLASPILDRNKKQIYFTITGELILQYTNRILHLCNEADKAILYLKKLRRISLTIGSNEEIGIYLLPKVIKLFCKYYSYVSIAMEIESTHFICWEVLNGKLDLGIVRDEEIPIEFNNLLYTIPYFKEKIVLILPKSYTLKDINSIPLEDLYNLDFIGLNSDFLERKILNKILQKYDINVKRLKTKFELNSIEAIKRAVQAGLGVSFVSILTVQDELLAKRIQSVKVNKKEIEKILTIIINPKAYRSHLSVKFYKYCFLLLDNNNNI